MLSVFTPIWSPFLDGIGDKLGVIVRSYMRRWTPWDEQLGQRSEHIFMPKLARHDERQTFRARLVDYGQDAEIAAIMCPSSTKS